MGKVEIKMPRVDENGHPTRGCGFSPLDSGDPEEIRKAQERTAALAQIGDRARAHGTGERRTTQ